MKRGSNGSNDVESASLQSSLFSTICTRYTAEFHATSFSGPHFLTCPMTSLYIEYLPKVSSLWYGLSSLRMLPIYFEFEKDD